MVLLINERTISGESKSFRERAIGPYKIIGKFNDVNFKIIDLNNQRQQVVHYNRLRRYCFRENA